MLAGGVETLAEIQLKLIGLLINQKGHQTGQLYNFRHSLFSGILS